MLFLIALFFAVFINFCNETDEDIDLSAGTEPIIKKVYKDLPDIKIGSHYPDLSEREACGQGNFRIKPFSYRFYTNMIYYDHPSIIFKGDITPEYSANNHDNKTFSNPKNNYNHYIHPKLISPLEELARLIKEYDPELRLRVTSAYRNWEVWYHYYNSLHHVGRAVDVTLYDIKDNLIPREAHSLLYNFSIKAGFDWVYFEDKYHFHLSIKPDNLNKPILYQYQTKWYGDIKVKGYEMAQSDQSAMVKRRIRLDEGIYSFRLMDGDTTYGYRGDSCVLGVSNLQGIHWKYVDQPIKIKVTSPGFYYFYFWPDQLRFKIKGDKPVEYLDSPAMTFLLESVKLEEGSWELSEESK